jgi:hypothetical protein
MTTDFEQQLERMLPLMREKEPETNRLPSIATTLLGFALGMLVMYCYMQPTDSLCRVEPQQSFRLVLDESAIQHLRTPADVARYVVRVPIQKTGDRSLETEVRYSTLYSLLLAPDS